MRRTLAAAGLAGLAAAFLAPDVLAADARRGETLYSRCVGCHAIDYDRTGPRHCGILGRRAAAVPDFPYSPAMKRSGLVWDEETLDRFLASPMQAVPGTSMGYAGVDDPKDRADLIAFLAQAGDCAAK